MPRNIDNPAPTPPPEATPGASRTSDVVPGGRRPIEGTLTPGQMRTALMAEEPDMGVVEPAPTDTPEAIDSSKKPWSL